MNWGAKLFVLDGVTFGSAGNSQISLADGAHIEFDNNFTISGGGVTFLTNSGGYFECATVTPTVSANISYSFAMFFCVGLSYSAAPGGAWTLGGHTVTGKKYDVETNAVLIDVTNIPGSVAGTTSTGGQVL
jgi:hypothetical protein